MDETYGMTQKNPPKSVHPEMQEDFLQRTPEWRIVTVKRKGLFVGSMVLVFLAGFSPSVRALELPPALVDSREKVLRCLPPQAALVLYVQDLHTRWEQFRHSAFLRVFPQTELGRELHAALPFQQVQQVAELILRELKTTPEELLEDVFGQVVAFTYTPAQEQPVRPESSLLVLAPRRPARLQALVQRLNELQIQSTEVSAVEQRQQDQWTYFVRKKGTGQVDYYAFSHGLFLFSTRESELQAALQRLGGSETTSPWKKRWQRWGWNDMTVIVAVEPRRWDAQWASRLGQAKGQEKALLQRWSQVWSGIEAVAIGLHLHRDVDLHLILEVTPQRLPQPWQHWWFALASPAPQHLLPPDAWLTVQGYGRLADWLDRLDVLLPHEDQRSLSQWLEQSLGPLLGRDHFPAVRECLGPHWAVWLEPPVAENELPIIAGVVSFQGEKTQRQRAIRAICQALTFAFHAWRVQYNATHVDQITWIEPKLGEAGLSGMLVNGRGFPSGVAPCFAVIEDHLILSSSPVALQRLAQRLQRTLDGPTVTTPPPVQAWPIATFHIRQIQEYLQQRPEQLARSLAPLVGMEQKDLSELFRRWAVLLEPIESLQLLYERKDQRICWTLRCQLRWPLQPEK